MAAPLDHSNMFSGITNRFLDRLDPETARIADIILNPKIVPGPDGNVTVSATKMQEIHNLLRLSIREAETVASLARVMLQTQVAGRTPNTIDTLMLSRRAPATVKELRGILHTFEEALPFNGISSLGKRDIRCVLFPEVAPAPPTSAPAASAPAASAEDEDLYA